MIAPSTCTCAGRNALRGSPNDHAKNLYTGKEEARLYFSKGSSPFSYNHVCCHPWSLFSDETAETATVMRKGFAAFLTQDPARIANPESSAHCLSKRDGVLRPTQRNRGYPIPSQGRPYPIRLESACR